MINNPEKETPLNFNSKDNMNPEEYYSNVKDEAISSVNSLNKNRTNSNSSCENEISNNSDSFTKLSNSQEKSNMDSVNSEDNINETTDDINNSNEDNNEVIEEEEEKTEIVEDNENDDDNNVDFNENLDDNVDNNDEQVEEDNDFKEMGNDNKKDFGTEQEIVEVHDLNEENKLVKEKKKVEEEVKVDKEIKVEEEKKDTETSENKTTEKNIENITNIKEGTEDSKKEEGKIQNEKITNDDEKPKKPNVIPNFSEEQIRKTVNHYKQTADNFFRTKNYKAAIENYEKGLNYLHFEKKPGQKNILIDKLLAIKYLNNKTQCLLNLKESQKALSNALFVIQLDTFNIKGYYRAGKACEDLKDYETGYKILQKGLQYLEKDHFFRPVYIKLFNFMKNENNKSLNAMKNKMKNFGKKKEEIKQDKIENNVIEKNEGILLWNKKVFAYSILNSILLSGVCPYLYNNNLHDKFVLPISNFIEWFGKFFNFNKLLSVLAVFGLGYTIGYLFNYFLNNKNREKKILK